jgi:hypothetical protein
MKLKSMEFKEKTYKIELNKFQIDTLEYVIDYVIKVNKDLSKKEIMLLLSTQSEISHSQE